VELLNSREEDCKLLLLEHLTSMEVNGIGWIDREMRSQSLRVSRLGTLCAGDERLLSPSWFYVEALHHQV
jgi:hypothetical protein